MNKFDAIQARANKPSYKYLDKKQIRLLRLGEEKDMLSKSIATTYRLGKIKYGDGFRQDERFFDNFDLIFMWEEKKAKVQTAICKIEELSEFSLVQTRRMQNERRRGYGGSF
jgi:hypothetical protein